MLSGGNRKNEKKTSHEDPKCKTPSLFAQVAVKIFIQTKITDFATNRCNGQLNVHEFCMKC